MWRKRETQRETERDRERDRDRDTEREREREGQSFPMHEFRSWKRVQGKECCEIARK